MRLLVLALCLSASQAGAGILECGDLTRESWKMDHTTAFISGMRNGFAHGMIRIAELNQNAEAQAVVEKLATRIFELDGDTLTLRVRDKCAVDPKQLLDLAFLEVITEVLAAMANENARELEQGARDLDI